MVYKNTFYKVKHLDIKKLNHEILEVNRGARIRPKSGKKERVYFLKFLNFILKSQEGNW